MSQPLYTVTLTAAEVDLIETIIDRKVGATLIPEPRATLAARRAAKPNARSKPWRPTGPPLESIMTVPSTPALEAWLQRRATPGYTPRPFAMPAPSKPKKMTPHQRQQAQAFADQAVNMWRSLGHVVVVEPGVNAVGKASNAVAIDWRNVRVLPLGVTE